MATLWEGMKKEVEVAFPNTDRLPRQNSKKETTSRAPMYSTLELETEAMGAQDRIGKYDQVWVSHQKANSFYSTN